MDNKVYIKPKILNFQKKTEREKSLRPWVKQEFLDIVQEAQPIKEKYSQIGLSQNWKLWFNIRPIKKIRKQATDWEKYLQNIIYDKGLVSDIFLKISKHNNKKITHFLKWAKD